MFGISFIGGPWNIIYYFPFSFCFEIKVPVMIKIGIKNNNY